MRIFCYRRYLLSSADVILAFFPGLICVTYYNIRPNDNIFVSVTRKRSANVSGA